jgi:hypothetical protein
MPDGATGVLIADARGADASDASRRRRRDLNRTPGASPCPRAVYRQRRPLSVVTGRGVRTARRVLMAVVLSVLALTGCSSHGHAGSDGAPAAARSLVRLNDHVIEATAATIQYLDDCTGITRPKPGCPAGTAVVLRTNHDVAAGIERRTDALARAARGDHHWERCIDAARTVPPELGSLNARLKTFGRTPSGGHGQRVTDTVKQLDNRALARWKTTQRRCLTEIARR